MNKIIIGVTMLLLITVLLLSYILDKKISENKRLLSNQTALMTDIKHYKTKDGLNAAKINVLELNKKELKQYNSELVETVKNLEIRLKDVNSISHIKTITEINIETNIIDSVVYNFIDSLIFTIDTVKVFNYSDDWIKFKGIISNNTIKTNIKSIEKLQCIHNIVKKKFLFFRWGVKEENFDVVSKNPYTNIENIEYIKVIK